MKTYEVTVTSKMTYRSETVVRIVTVQNIEEEIKCFFRGVDPFLFSALRYGITPNIEVNYKAI